jgi:hypothetical protein
MRDLLRTGAASVLFLWSVAAARADGLGPRGYEMIGGVGLSGVIGGLILSATAILAGFYLVRGRERWPAGVWRKIAFLVVFGLVVLFGGPALTLWYFGR